MTLAAQQKKNTLLLGFAVAILMGLMILLALSGGNLMLVKTLFAHDLSNEEVKDLLAGFGWRGYIAVAALSALQVVCFVLPAEPVQILAGVTFPFPVGLLCCMAGVFLGNTLIYMLQKHFGERLRSLVSRRLELDVESIAQSGKGAAVIFLLFFLPGIPYGIICFLAAGMGMGYRRYSAVTVAGALPSAAIGVALGYTAVMSHWAVPLSIFAVMLLTAVLLFRNQNTLLDKLQSYAKRHKAGTRNRVRPVNRFWMTVLYGAVRIYLFLSGVTVKTVNKVGVPEAPAIVLCNHGSFIDFIYAAALLRQYKPHFLVARLYFYHPVLGWLLRQVGAFPKSMFTTDLENAKNCLTVLKNRELLAMMPEARLSTAGQFEDIQSSTYAFIKRAGVNVYTVTLRGDYLADPKWGKGLRRGALVEAELELLYTAGQIGSLTPEQVKEGVRQRLYYDEFQWLDQRPQVRYRSRSIARGLENILSTCPLCGGKYTLTTKKNRVSCRHCGPLTRVDDRYGFDAGFRFRDLSQWYQWQKERMAREIEENWDFALTSAVELRHRGTGLQLTRHSGFGICSLNREGLTYTGTRDGRQVQLHFPIRKLYRLLFGAGVNFEFYDGSEIYFFVPEEKRSAVDWYIASMLLHDSQCQEGTL